MNDNAWIINEDAWCEHCGKLEQYDLTFWDGCSCWCEDCACANGEKPPSKRKKQSSLRVEIRQFKARLEQLKSELSNDIPANTKRLV
jgi:hypothetical protein